MTDLTQTIKPKRISLLHIVGGAFALTAATIGSLWMLCGQPKPSKESQIPTNVGFVKKYISEDHKTVHSFYLQETKKNPEIRSEDLQTWFRSEVNRYELNKDLPRNENFNIKWESLRPGQSVWTPDIYGDGQ